MNPTAYWDALDSVGWFEAYTPEALDALRLRLQRQFESQGGDLVLELGTPLVDPEAMVDRRYCAWLLERYALASAGRFQPEDVVLELGKRGQPSRLTYRLGGSSFTREFAYEMMTVEGAIHALANEGLASLDSPYRFFELPGADAVGIALVRPEAYERAKEMGLLTPSWASPA